MIRYKAIVLEELARHGLRPGPTSQPAKLREQINDLYRIEIRKPGFETLQFDVQVQPDRTITYRGELRPTP